MPRKKMNPMAAWRESRRKVLDLFEDEEAYTWPDLWKKAKSKGMNYTTFKNHMENLTKTKLIQQELDTNQIPAIVKYRCNPEHFLDVNVIYFDDVVSFIESTNRNLDRALITKFGVFLLSEARGKKLAESIAAKSHKFQIREEISEEWRKEVLSKYSLEEKRIINEYHSALMDYAWLHQRYKKEDIIKAYEAMFSASPEKTRQKFTPLQDKINNIEKVFGLTFYSFESAKKWIAQQKEAPPNSFRIAGFKKPSTEQELKEKERLETFLVEHEELYERFQKEVENVPKIVMVFPSYAFRGYQKTFAEAFLQLPQETRIEIIKGDKEGLKELRNVATSTLKSFGEQSIVYRCAICGRLYKKKKKLENHIKYDEKYSIPLEVVQKLDKEYFLEAIRLVDEKLAEESNQKS